MCLTKCYKAEEVPVLSNGQHCISVRFENGREIIMGFDIQFKISKHEFQRYHTFVFRCIKFAFHTKGQANTIAIVVWWNFSKTHLSFCNE